MQNSHVQTEFHADEITLATGRPCHQWLLKLCGWFQCYIHNIPTWWITAFQGKIQPCFCQRCLARTREPEKAFQLLPWPSPWITHSSTETHWPEVVELVTDRELHFPCPGLTLPCSDLERTRGKWFISAVPQISLRGPNYRFLFPLIVNRLSPSSSEWHIFPVVLSIVTCGRPDNFHLLRLREF